MTVSLEMGDPQKTEGSIRFLLSFSRRDEKFFWMC